MGTRHAATPGSFRASGWVVMISVLIIAVLGCVALGTASAATTQAVYRLKQNATGDDFLTASAVERSAALASGTYSDAGTAFTINTSDPDNSAPVYRLASSAGRLLHFYTISPAERDAAVASKIWVYEGIAFHVSAVPNSAPVFRLVKPSNGSHYYTTSAAQRDSYVASGAWRYEGVAWYLAQHDPVTITFDSNGGSAVTALTGEYGASLAAPAAPTKSGNTFGGWYRDNAAFSSPFSFTTYPANSLTVYAKWAPITYQLTFVTNGGSTVSAISAPYGSTVTAPTAPTRTGYSFGGWYSNAALTTAFTFPAAMPLNGATLYAKWVPNQYDLTFMDGTTTLKTSKVAYGSAISALSPAPAKTGYTFANWYSNAALTGSAYQFDTMPMSNLTLFAKWTINSYMLTYTAGTGGSISGTTPQTVNYNASGSAVTAVPATGYHFVSWSDGVLTATRTDKNVTADKVVTANFAIDTFTLSYTAGTGGSISGTTPQTVNYNASGSAVTAVPATGYHFTGWSDGVETAQRTDKNTTADLTVTATFAIDTFTLTYTAGDNGSISGTTPQTVDYNASGTEVEAVPATGYHFVSWSDGVLTAQRTDTGVKADVTAEASFAINEYTLTYTASDGGSISGTTPQTVKHGADGAAVTAVPATGYHFTGWSDGVETAQRTDKNIAADLTVTATFAINEYTLTYVAGTGGTISGSTPQTVNHGSDGTSVTATPDAGYRFLGWSDGLSTATRTDSNIVADKSVTATFQKTYTLSYVNFDGNGTISGSTTQVVDAGADGTTVTAVPKAGYNFAGWSDGVMTAERTDLAVSKDITVGANFSIKWFSLNYGSYGHGTVTGEIPQVVSYGSDATAITAIPDEGYHFTNWDDGSTANPRQDKNVTKDIVENAHFALNEYTLTFMDGATELWHVAFDYGTPISAPTTIPTKTGHTFKGWVDGSGKAYVFTTVPAHDVTIYADWDVESYELTLLDGETTLSTTPLAYGSTIGIPEAPPAKLYDRFVHWYVSDPDVAYDGTATMGVEGFTLHARYDAVYVVTYRDGKTTLSTAEATVGSYLGAPEEPTKAGYRILGWYRDPALTRPWYFETSVMPDNDIILYGKWIKQWTLSYTAGDNGSVSGELSQTVDQGKAGTPVTAVPDENYEFVDWSDGVKSATRTDTPASGHVSATANFAPKKFSLTFVADGSSETTEVAYGAIIAAASPAPTKEHYTFAAWYDNESFTGDPYTFGTMPASDVTLYAKFDVNWHYLTFMADATTQFGSTWSAAYDADLAVIADSMGHPTEPTGYHFDGWYDNAAGTGTAYIPGTMPDAALTLYAKFVPNTHDVTFMADGELFGTYPAISYGDSMSAPGTPTKTGHTFSGWYELAADGVTKVYWTFNPEVGSTKMPDYDVTLTADFTAKSYTLTLKTEGARDVTESVAYGSSLPLPSEDPSKTGYTFEGWVDGLGNYWTDSDTMPAGDLTLTADFTINTYDVTFLVDGVTYATCNGASYGQLVPAPPAPSKTGHTFVGWYDGETKWEFQHMGVPARDVTLNAQFTIDQYTLGYIAGANGSLEGSASQTVDYGTSGTAVTAVPATGYRFSQWSDGSTENPRTDVNVSDNVKVTAYFDKILLSATYTPVGYGYIEYEATPYYSGLVHWLYYGESAKTATAVPYTGYHFTGWSDGVTTASRTDTNLTGSIDVEANFAINSYTLSYGAGANGSIEGSATQTVDYDTDGTAVTAVPSAGYHFVRWSDGSTANPRTDSTVRADLNVTASFERNQYYVRYDVINEGGYLTSPVFNWTFIAAAFPIYEGDDCPAITAVPYRGYEFAGWSDGLIAPTRQETHVTAEQSYTAYFKVQELSVKYSAGTGGTISGETSQTVQYNGAATPVTAVADEGYTFSRWSDGVETATRTDIGLTADLDVTAEFTPIEYELVLMDGDTELSRRSVAYNSEIGVLKDGPAREGYLFAYWYVDDPNVPFDPTTTMPIGGMTLQAYYEIAYTAYFMDGTDVVGTAVVAVGDSLTPPDTTKDGYAFIGWYRDAAFMRPYNFKNSVMPENDIKIYGKWEATGPRTTLTFDTMVEGVSIAPLTGTVGADLTGTLALPRPADRTNATFKRWMVLTGEDTYAEFTGTTMPESDTTLYAQWEVTWTFTHWEYGPFFTVTGMGGADPTDMGPAVWDALNERESATWWMPHTDAAATMQYDEEVWDFGIEVPREMTAEPLYFTQAAYWQFNAPDGSFVRSITQYSGTSGMNELINSWWDEWVADNPEYSKTAYPSWERYADAALTQPLGTWDFTAQGSDVMGLNPSYFKLKAAVTHTVLFDGNGKSGGTVPASQTVVDGGKLTNPGTTLERTGFTHVGWSTVKDDANTVWNFASGTVTAPTTLYALWEPLEYTLYYSSPFGTQDPVTAPYGTLLAEPTAPVDPNANPDFKMSFMYWYQYEYVGGTWVMTPITWPYAMPENGGTLTALYGYNLTLDYQDGSTAPSTETYQYNDSINMPDLTGTRPGYVFEGWFDEPTGGTKQNFTWTMWGLNTTFYAQWTEVDPGGGDTGGGGDPQPAQYTWSIYSYFWDPVTFEWKPDTLIGTITAAEGDDITAEFEAIIEGTRVFQEWYAPSGYNWNSPDFVYRLGNTYDWQAPVLWGWGVPYPAQLLMGNQNLDLYWDYPA